MNKTIKLLTVALALTTATQSFPMFRSLSRFATSARASVAPRINSIMPALNLTPNRTLRIVPAVNTSLVKPIKTNAMPSRFLSTNQNNNWWYRFNEDKKKYTFKSNKTLGAVFAAGLFGLFNDRKNVEGQAHQGSWRKTKTLPEHDTVSYIKYSPDGKRVITASRWKKEIFVRDADSFEKIAVIQIPDHINIGRYKFDLLNIDFNHDGTKIIGFANGWTFAWDAQTYQLTHYVKDHSGLFWSPSLNKDRTMLITGGEFDTGCCEIRDAKTFETIVRIGDKKGIISRASFSPDGTKVIFVKDLGEEVEIWSAVRGYGISSDKLTSISSDFGVNKKAEFSPDGNKVIILNCKTLSVWDASSYKQLAAFPTLSKDTVSGYHNAQFSNDGKYLFAQDSQLLRIWDSVTLQQIAQIDNVYQYSINQDSTGLVVSSYHGNVRLCDVTGKEIEQFDASNTVTLKDGQKKKDDISSVQFTPDGKKVLVASFWGTPLQIWEAQQNTNKRLDFFEF